jgi:ketosteroid isomerase-like protein
MTLAEIVQRGWDAVAAGDLDTLVADYTPDMIFIMPGQTDLIEGIPDFRAAVENLGAAVPAGFEIRLTHHSSPRCFDFGATRSTRSVGS